MSGCSWWPSEKGQGTGIIITCLNMQGHSQRAGTQEPKKHGAREPCLKPSQGVQVQQEQGPHAGVELRGRSSWFPAHATSGAGVGICHPKRGPKGQAAASSCQGNGKGPPAPHPRLPSCESAGTAGDTVPGWGTSPSVAPAGTTGHPSSAGPACTETRVKPQAAFLGKGSHSGTRSHCVNGEGRCCIGLKDNH